MSLPSTSRRLRGLALGLGLALLAAGTGACGFIDSLTQARESDASPGGAGRGGPGGRGGFPGGPQGFGGGAQASAIPVQVMAVARRDISQYLETNGVLEAENDVDLVARTTGPIVELRAEEGMKVERGQILARIDDEEIRAQIEISKVTLAEMELAFARAKRSFDQQIVSQEVFDTTKSRLDTAAAQLESNEVQLGYTTIRAPFTGVVVERHIKFAEHVQSGTPLFRIADFDPLQCPIQVPEKDLGMLAVGQPAHLVVEAYRDDRFEAEVLRVSPIVDAATGTVKVTLEVATRGKLRPGMFASVFLQVDEHQGALVVPKAALVLESIGDTVYVMDGDVARRREVELGYDEADDVEIVAGLAEGDRVIVLGQDSLSEGTPVYVLEGRASRAELAGGRAGGEGTPFPSGPEPRPEDHSASGAGEPAARPTGGAGGAIPGGAGGFGGRGFPDPSQLTPEMLDMMKERMRGRGLSDEQIEQRIEMMKKGEMPPRPPGA